jgi:hypothetical protein
MQNGIFNYPKVLIEYLEEIGWKKEENIQQKEYKTEANEFDKSP